MPRADGKSLQEQEHSRLHPDEKRSRAARLGHQRRAEYSRRINAWNREHMTEPDYDEKRGAAYERIRAEVYAAGDVDSVAPVTDTDDLEELRDWIAGVTNGAGVWADRLDAKREGAQHLTGWRQEVVRHLDAIAREASGGRTAADLWLERGGPARSK